VPAAGSARRGQSAMAPLAACAGYRSATRPHPGLVGPLGSCRRTQDPRFIGCQIHGLREPQNQWRYEPRAAWQAMSWSRTWSIRPAEPPAAGQHDDEKGSCREQHHDCDHDSSFNPPPPPDPSSRAMRLSGTRGPTSVGGSERPAPGWTSHRHQHVIISTTRISTSRRSIVGFIDRLATHRSIRRRCGREGCVSPELVGHHSGEMSDETRDTS
jgi:hypothetical protein